MFNAQISICSKNHCKAFHFSSVHTDMLLLEHTSSNQDTHCSTVTKYLGIVLQINYITCYQHDHYASL